MFSVYILQNNLTGRYYIGSTNDIHRRLIEHNRGQTRSTRRKGTWNVIYLEAVATFLDAKRKEQLYKSYKSGNAFKKLLEHAAVVQR